MVLPSAVEMTPPVMRGLWFVEVSVARQCSLSVSGMASSVVEAMNGSSAGVSSDPRIGAVAQTVPTPMTASAGMTPVAMRSFLGRLSG